MKVTDSIADMLTRIRNAGRAKFNSVDIPGSKMKIDIARVLKSEGYIKNYKFVKDSKQGVLRVYLKYGPDSRHAIYGIERASKSSRRLYSKSKNIKPVLNGLGISILTTSRGVMADKEAKKMNTGGEVICRVW